MTPNFPRLPLIAFILVLLAAAAPLRGEDFEGRLIGSIAFEGRVLDSAGLTARLESVPGEPFRAATLRRDMRVLGEALRKVEVRLEPAGEDRVDLIFSVAEFPVLREWQVVGNQALSAEELDEAAALTPGERLDATRLRALRRSLRRAYREAGLPQTVVRTELIDWQVPEDEGEPTMADLQVLVDEGERLFVGDIEIEGNEAFGDGRLRRQMQTRESGWFTEEPFDPLTFDDDLLVLREYYTARGYFDATVERGLFDERTEDERRYVDPRVVIDEGERYRFGTIEVRGARLFAHEDLMEPFAGLEGEPFSGKAWFGAAERLRTLYDTHGLLTTRLETAYAYDRDAARVDITVNVTEGRRIHVGRVRLERPRMDVEEAPSLVRRWYESVSPPIKPEAVMREVRLAPGDVYNKRLERESMRRLARLEVFERETLAVWNEPTGEPGVHDMVIHAEDTITGAVSLGAGFGDASGGFLFLSLDERNLGGEGNQLTLRGLLGERTSSVRLRHFERSIGESGDSLETQLYYRNLARPGYDARVIGSQLEWGHEIGGDWTRYLAGRLDHVDQRPDGDEEPEEDLDQQYVAATLRLALRQDRLTIPPRGPLREGFTQGGAVEAGVADGFLGRFEVSRDQYWVLVRERLGWRTRLTAGVMPMDATDVPMHERYFLGGDGDLRGFRYRGAGRRDPGDDDVPRGGAGKWLLTNELIFPIYDPVSGVLFSDVGALADDPADWQGVRAGAGAGLRLDLPFVSVALDFAAPVLREDTDERRLFHFSISGRL